MMTKLMIVGTKESFLIRSLMKKLSENAIEPFYTDASVDAVSRDFSRADMIAVYFDNTAPVANNVLLYIKDQVSEHPKGLFLIGERGDLDDAESVIPKEMVTTEFERPLNPDVFLEAMRIRAENASELVRKKSILIVDDDPTYMGLVRDWLKDDYNVSMANSGAQAIKFLGMNVADLILLDHEMPVVSGPKVLEMLRSDPDTMGIPVIFLTGKQDRESVMQVVALKPEGYLLKTITKDALKMELLKFFRERG